MVRVKVCVVTLATVAALLLLGSCDKNRAYLVIQSASAGAYTVDVANWHLLVQGSDSTYYATNRDAHDSLQVAYVRNSDYPSYPPTSQCHLTKYTVKWDAKDSLPNITGSLDGSLESQTTPKAFTNVMVLVMPATCKDTVPVLLNLRGDPAPDDPGSLYTLVGERQCHAVITIDGHDDDLNEDISGSMDLTALFGDYPDPNTDH